MKRLKISLSLVAVLIIIATGCSSLNIDGNNNGSLTASGTISAHQIDIVSEVGGRILEVHVEEGSFVEAGDLLISIDDEIIQAQYEQALSAVGLAESAVGLANAQLRSAEVQFEVVLQAARQQDYAMNSQAWQADQPDDFSLPVWYFDDSDELAAAQTEVDNAFQFLEEEEANLEDLLQTITASDLIAAETRMAEAQANYIIASQTLSQASTATDNEKVEEVAQAVFDEAESELNSAQAEYDRILSNSDTEEIHEARARVAVAQLSYENTLNYYEHFLTGEDSLQVAAAQTAVEVARAGVSQAEANLEHANSALSVLEIQMEKFEVFAPISGTLITRSIDEGETIRPGSVAFTIGQIDEVQVTVYVPEDKYGRISLGQSVTVSVDSFPGEEFDGEVIRIADQAEFTPRNVQTVEGRKSTVYAVKISVPNPLQKLKPGMPADVILEE